MDDVKRAARETETDAKKAWRNRDGEDLGDKIGNFGDDVRTKLGNLGDEVRHGINDHPVEHRPDELERRRDGILDDPAGIDDPDRVPGDEVPRI